MPPIKKSIDPRTITLAGQRAGYLYTNPQALALFVEWTKANNLTSPSGGIVMPEDLNQIQMGRFWRETFLSGESTPEKPEEGSASGPGPEGESGSGGQNGDGLPGLPNLPNPNNEGAPNEGQGEGSSTSSSPGEEAGDSDSSDQGEGEPEVPSAWNQPSSSDILSDLLGNDPSKPIPGPEAESVGDEQQKKQKKQKKPGHRPSWFEFLRFYSKCLDETTGAHLPILLVGPKGCGKTTGGKLLAQDLGLPFWAVSINEGMSEEKLFGYPELFAGPDGQKAFDLGPVLRAIVGGGVCLFDEADACNPNVALSLNSVLANGFISVPGYRGGEVIEVHPDFIPVFSMNTFGAGATREYIGRNAQDAAFLDRMMDQTIEIDYDEDLERKLGHPEAVKFGHRIRKKCRFNPDGSKRQEGWRRDISTRNILNWSAQIRAGAPLSGAIFGHFSSWSEAELKKVGLVRHVETRYMKEL